MLSVTPAPPITLRVLRYFASRGVFAGIFISVLLHSSIALGLYSLFGGFASAGNSSPVYMVSFEDAVPSKSGSGIPAFSLGRENVPISRVVPLPLVNVLTVRKTVPHQTRETDSFNRQKPKEAQLVRPDDSLSVSAVVDDQALSTSGLQLGAGGENIPAQGSGGHAGRAIISAPNPPYPILARRLGFEGRVLLEIGVAPNGVPVQVLILKSSGRSDCDESARATVLNQWRFASASATNVDLQRLSIRFELR